MHFLSHVFSRIFVVILLLVSAETQGSICSTKAKAVGQNYIYVFLSLGFQRDIIKFESVMLAHMLEVQRRWKDTLSVISTVNCSAKVDLHLS